jgi:hypothetical protein
MTKGRLLPQFVAASLCSLLLGFSPSSFAATATDLVTICTSATTTIQASKCTAWQYNYYSPTVYIESYPQVSPGPTGYYDPNYEYRLGSTLTPTNGVKVCPTALTPGVSFTSTAADPCPNNKLVAASTVLPTSSYAVTTIPNGIVVYQINASGVSEVAGGPFVESPVLKNFTGTGTVISPSLIASDPSGEYLYAMYNTGFYGPDWVYTYKMINGVPNQLADAEIITSNGDSNPIVAQILASTQHLFAVLAPGNAPPSVGVWKTANGILSLPSYGSALYANVDYALVGTLINIAVDPQEQFLYWYYSSTSGSVADTVAIFSLSEFDSAPGAIPNSLRYIQSVPIQGALVVDAQ